MKQPKSVACFAYQDGVLVSRQSISESPDVTLDMPLIANAIQAESKGPVDVIMAVVYDDNSSEVLTAAADGIGSCWISADDVMPWIEYAKNQPASRSIALVS